MLAGTKPLKLSMAVVDQCGLEFESPSDCDFKTLTCRSSLKFLLWISSYSMMYPHYRKIGTFNASQELPYDLEDSLVLWINKVGMGFASLTACSYIPPYP